VSGICGICEPGMNIHRERIETMMPALSLPGENGQDIHSGTSIAFGVARRWPTQEFFALPGIRLAADTDVTNWRDVTVYLESKGVRTQQLARGELLAQLYLLDGPGFVKKLEGGFALALWDEKTRRLLLAIDPLGLKTLYFAQEGNRLLFSSRSGAIQAVQKRPGGVNSAAVMQFLLFSVVTAPLSIYQDIERLQPGCYLTFEGDCARQQQYWDLEYSEDKEGDEQIWAKLLREQMRDAVHRHLDGCTAEDTGAYLSGGTDSSSVVAFMSEQFSPCRCFSISFPTQGYNEIEYARATAQRFRSQHHELCMSPQDAMDAIPKVVAYYDEPFANSSALASYHCALLASRNGVETLLAGDGGDELFAGNERYASDKRFAIYHSVPRWFRRGVVEPLASLLPVSDGALSLPRRYIQRANIPNPRRTFSYNVFLSMDPREVFERDFLQQAPPETWMGIAEGHFKSAKASSELNRMMHLDIKIILADNDLRKVSGTAEMADVRVRYPLLDRRLADFSGRIPAGLKLKGAKLRYIFKRAMKDILPDVVLSKKKHGFGVPIGNWILQDARLKSLGLDILNDPRTRQRGYFRSQFYDRMVDLHHRDHAAYYGEVIWYLIALELWHRAHFEKNVAESLHAR
jgi:asparagine synthase (glutamine-hydrolysing)